MINNNLIEKRFSYEVSSEHAITSKSLLSTINTYINSIKTRIISNDDQIFIKDEYYLAFLNKPGTTFYFYFDNSNTFIFNYPQCIVFKNLSIFTPLVKILSDNQIEQCLLELSCILSSEDMNKAVFSISHFIQVNYKNTFSNANSQLSKLFQIFENTPFDSGFIDILEKKDLNKYTDNLGKQSLSLISSHYRYSIQSKQSFSLAVIGYTVDNDKHTISSLLLGTVDNDIVTECCFFSYLPKNLNSKLLTSLKELHIESSISKSYDNSIVQFVSPDISLDLEGIVHSEQNLLNLCTSYTFSSSYTYRNQEYIPSLSYLTMKSIVNTSNSSKLQFNIYIPKYETKEPVILSQKVYKKVFRGSELIKKFMLIKTNNPNSASYCIYFLDYSNNRKEPLQPKLYPFYSIDKAESFLKKIKDTEINDKWSLI